MATNRQIVLVNRPEGMPKESDFALREVELPDLEDDQVRIEVSHLSIDAFIRTTLEDGGIHATTGLETPVMALGVGRVAESRFAGLDPDDWVFGPMLAQTHAQLPGAMYQKIDTEIAAPSTYLGILGMTTGLTAYFGLHHAVEINAGETLVVSGAAGAVGSVVCQLGKIAGATVVGIAGGPEKCAYLTGTIGADHAVDYKSGDVGEALDAAIPGGVDVYFDNVGGELLDTVLDRIRTGARVSICGAISQYQHLGDVRGPALYLRLAERNARMCGFTVDHYQAQFGEAVARLAGWMAEGKLELPEHVIEGIERFPEALNTLFTGGHMGKLLVKP